MIQIKHAGARPEPMQPASPLVESEPDAPPILAQDMVGHRPLERLSLARLEWPAAGRPRANRRLYGG